MECYNAYLPLWRSAIHLWSIDAPLKLPRERYSALMPLLRECYLIWGSSWPVEENKGRIFQVWKAVAFKFLVPSGDPWSKEGIPQLVLKINQEVKLLLTYISRLYDGGKGRTASMKPMILEETHSQPKESDQWSCCYSICGSFRQGLDEEDLTKLLHSHLRL